MSTAPRGQERTRPLVGRAKGRTAPEQVSCFLNYVGLGYQFAAVGSLLHRKARELGVREFLVKTRFSYEELLEHVNRHVRQ